jgi:hypothetical protein
MKTTKNLAATLLLCLATVASAQEEKPKTAIIRSSSMEATLYLDFAGGRYAMEAFAPSFDTTGISGYYHLRAITDATGTTVINMDAKTGVRHSSFGWSPVKHPDSIFKEGLRKVGEEEVHGRICDKYVVDSLQYKKFIAQQLGRDSSSEEVLAKIIFPEINRTQTIWMWNGVVMQTGHLDHVSGKFVTLPDDITDIQVNVSLPAEKFAIPEGTIIQAAATGL